MAVIQVQIGKNTIEVSLDGGFGIKSSQKVEIKVGASKA